MTDTDEALIKRLRFCWLTLTRDEIHQAANHIEKLETENKGYRLALADQLQIRQQLEADKALLREHLESAIDTLRDAEVCDDTCVHCNEARAALQETSQ